jgi:hypothetical protein
MECFFVVSRRVLLISIAFLTLLSISSMSNAAEERIFGTILDDSNIRKNQEASLGLEHLEMEMPKPLPFSGCQFEPGQNMKYRSTFDVQTLIGSARDELAIVDPEAFKVFFAWNDGRTTAPRD